MLINQTTCPSQVSLDVRQKTQKSNIDHEYKSLPEKKILKHWLEEAINSNKYLRKMLTKS